MDDAWSVNIMEEHELIAFQNRFKEDLDLRDRKKETQLKNNWIMRSFVMCIIYRIIL
jgi:hypothetical protein